MSASFRALSVRNPWANLIAAELKRIELRSWTTRYRGPLVIISSRTLDDVETFPDHVAKETCGVAIALVSLIDVTPYEDAHAEHALATQRGGFSWHLRLLSRLEPVPVKGQLGLYSIDGSLVRPL